MPELAMGEEACSRGDNCKLTREALGQVDKEQLHVLGWDDDDRTSICSEARLVEDLSDMEEPWQVDLPTFGHDLSGHLEVRCDLGEVQWSFLLETEVPSKESFLPEPEEYFEEQVAESPEERMPEIPGEEERHKMGAEQVQVPAALATLVGTPAEAWITLFLTQLLAASSGQEVRLQGPAAEEEEVEEDEEQVSEDEDEYDAEEPELCRRYPRHYVALETVHEQDDEDAEEEVDDVAGSVCSPVERPMEEHHSLSIPFGFASLVGTKHQGLVTELICHLAERCGLEEAEIEAFRASCADKEICSSRTKDIRSEDSKSEGQEAPAFRGLGLLTSGGA